MNIRGMQKFTLVDYPGKIACIFFVGNCNFRCPYCHNPCLVFDPESQPQIFENSVFEFLEKRRGKLEGVVISGGEPSLRKELKAFAARIKDMGFLVKIDTNGSNPDRVIECLEENLVDSLGVDYKAPAERYHEIAACQIDDLSQRVHRILKFAVEKQIPIDVRTTVHRRLLSRECLSQMRRELDELGVKEWTLQQFNPTEMIDDDLPNEPTYSDSELVRIARELGGNTKVRGLKGVLIN
jgi:pyruvate formate lyase activating enzyme